MWDVALRYLPLAATDSVLLTWCELHSYIQQTMTRSSPRRNSSLRRIEARRC